MKTAGGKHWHELLFHLQRNPLIASRLLRWPCQEPLPPETLLGQLQNWAGKRKLAPLLRRHLLTALALPQPSRPQPGQLAEDFSFFHPGFTEDQLLRSRWICLPILTCQGASAAKVWMLLGLVSGAQGIVFLGGPRPLDTAGAGASLALKAVECHLRSPAWGYLGITLQHPEDQPLSGGSLALPLALAMRNLQLGKPWPQEVYASGCLTEEGRITPVAGEQRKYSLVAQGMRLLLYPETSLLETSRDARLVRCTHLEQAEFALDCLQEGFDPGKILHYRACLNDPRLFLEHFADLPPALVHLGAGRELLARIKSGRHHLLPHIARCLAACQASPERAALLQDLFSVEEIAAVARQESEEAIAAHRWCVARVACGNRIGAVADSRAWIDLTHDLDQAIDTEKQVDCANHAFVTTRFNRYRFHPDPPAGFTRYLEIEQRRYDIDCRDNRLLGAMLGTLAQNYGFCGPDFRQQFAATVHRAETAFGRKYRRELPRLRAYQLYSLLETGEVHQAVPVLNRYLGLDEENTPDHWVAAVQHLWKDPGEHCPFQAALVCRMLAELVRAGHVCIQPHWCLCLASVMPRRLTHPWQLTACNLGRLFLACGLNREGAAWLRRSVDACLQGGIAMLPMGLPPLAVLCTANLAGPELHEISAKIVDAIRVSQELDHDHFKPLLQATNPGEALELVAAEPEQFFPFSYR